MDLIYLQSFAQVVESGSITKAAWELHLSQSAVSKHVQAVEAYYGHPLLGRAGREIQLTDEGRVLYRSIREALRLLDEARLEISEMGIQVRGGV